jgi:hypothetical protein
MVAKSAFDHPHINHLPPNVKGAINRAEINVLSLHRHQRFIISLSSHHQFTTTQSVQMQRAPNRKLHSRQSALSHHPPNVKDAIRPTKQTVSRFIAINVLSHHQFTATQSA